MSPYDEAPARRTATPWTEGRWGDQGDGRYVNPIVPADLSDFDCIRVGDEYYGITSTFGYSPGMAVLHSADLVTWTVIGHAIDDLTRIGPELNWDRMNRYGRGVWAGAIRHHAGRFWIYFATPDEGFFMTTATDPAGLWEPVHAMWRVEGWDDVCPIWDGDQPYLVATHFADDYKIHLFALTPDGRSLIHSSGTVIQQSAGSEASKLYAIDGYYYHLYSEVRPEGRVVMMNRGTALHGPYENRQLQHVDASIDREPNQGSLILGPDENWYWVTHHGTGGHWEGRVLSLLPVTWIDGWPVLGEVGADGIGSMVWSGAMPLGSRPRAALPATATSDDFTGPTLKPEWEWHYQPRADKWSLDERPGALRLHAFPPLEPRNLTKVGNTLTQRAIRAPGSTVTLRFELGGLSDGQYAGLCHFAATYAGLGVTRADGVTALSFIVDGTRTAGPVIAQDNIWFRSRWDLDGVSHFSYSLDGTTFADFGTPYQLTWGGYRGDRVGIQTYNPAGAGFVDVVSCDYTIVPPD
ncbi:family 43 glycosylhydrolase [Kribbella sp. CA-253562]|uniref:glycoside hydrolase family 43 protein n=1 Tax=Kribbella sp. CA-253562 TaxID=3239942 RepID=UPI003D8E3E8F